MSISSEANKPARQPNVGIPDRTPDLAEFLSPSDQIIVGEGPGEPVFLTRALCEQRAALSGLSVLMGIGMAATIGPAQSDHLRFRSYGALGTLRALAACGALDIIPCHISQLPAYIRSGIIGCDAVMLRLSPAGPNGRHSLGVVNLHLEAAIENARVIIAEINEHVPYTFGGATLGADELDLAVPGSLALPQSAHNPPSELTKAIGLSASQFIDDGSVLQIGIGAVPNAVLECLADRRNLGIHSGMIGDGVAALMQSGVITNSTKLCDTGITVTGLLFGTKQIYDYAHRNSEIAVMRTEHIYDPAVMAAMPKFISVNSAIEVDLTGQVNAEVANGRYLGAVGGHADFSRAAHISNGGRSIIALPSTTRDGLISRICARLAGPVTCSRADVDVIATEFGAVELKGRSLAERACGLIEIAHPAFREQLSRYAHDLPWG